MEYNKLIFVAQTGTCREAMAAGIMGDFTLRHPLEILSRGLVVQFQEPMNQKAEAVLISNGINMENYVSQQLTEEDLTEDALVITMEEIHRERILEQFENAIPENIQVLTKYVGDELEILDPYGGALPAYGLCYETLRKSIKKLVKNLTKKKEHKFMGKVVVMDHPLIQHKIGLMRRTETGSKDFRTLAGEVAMFECYEATRDLELQDVEIETPICKTTVKELKGKKLAVVPILRAGLGMVDGMLEMIPAAKVGHIGLYRDPETAKPVEYYCKLPADCANREVFVVDPMLATGGSAIAAIQMLKDKGVKSIRFMCIIAAPEGVKALTDAHPDVDLYIGALDDHLNEHKYIVPGLGDAGDRIFGTK